MSLLYLHLNTGSSKITMESVEKVIYGAYLYEKQAVLPPYMGSVFCFSTPS